MRCAGSGVQCAGRDMRREACGERRFPHLACGGVYLLPDTKTLFCHKRYLICDNIGKNTLYCHRFAFICDNTPLRNPHCHRITQIRDNTNTKHHYCHTSHKKCDSLVMRTLPAIHLPRQHAQEGPATRVSVDNSTKLLNLPHLPLPEHSGSGGTVLNELQEQNISFVHIGHKTSILPKADTLYAVQRKYPAVRPKQIPSKPPQKKHLPPPVQSPFFISLHL
jgi:hypothetical protein